jgi:hypothetical protein
MEKWAVVSANSGAGGCFVPLTNKSPVSGGVAYVAMQDLNIDRPAPAR